MEERQSFTFYRSFYEAVAQLQPEDQGEALMAICAYALDGVQRPVTGVPAAIFLLAKPNLDTGRRKAESGKFGGTVQADDKQARSKEEADAKQTGSKAKAKHKQTGSKAQASAKQTPSYGEGELGIRRKEGERERGDTPLPPSSEPKVQWADNVTMTNAEHDKLLATHGPADTARLIEILDNYKGSSGKVYANDYRAILSWCVDRLAESRRKGEQMEPAGNVFLDMLREEAPE